MPVVVCNGCSGSGLVPRQAASVAPGDHVKKLVRDNMPFATFELCSKCSGSGQMTVAGEQIPENQNDHPPAADQDG